MSESKEQAQPQIRKPPYTVDPGERESDGGDCWWINSEEGSVAEMICPADDAEATARFLSRAGNCHEEYKRLLNVSLDLLSDVYDSRASVLDG